MLHSLFALLTLSTHTQVWLTTGPPRLLGCKPLVLTRMILPPRSQIDSDPVSPVNASLNKVFLQGQLKPRDSGIGAFPDSSNILIALGVIIGLATICLIANFGLIRWGHRSLFSRLFCCRSRPQTPENESAAAPPIKARKVKTLKKPKIYDVSLSTTHTTVDHDTLLNWRNLMVCLLYYSVCRPWSNIVVLQPISVRYVSSTTKRLSHIQTNTPPASSVSVFPMIKSTPRPSPTPSHHQAAIRVAIAIAMPCDPNSCNTPCYELGTTDIAAPWKVVDRRKKDMVKMKHDMKENMDRRMAEAMLLRSA